MARMLVMLREGPASERGWLGLRFALALSLGGHDVTVYLFADSSGWALPVDARAWLGGDPGGEIDGLIDDAGATVLVDGDSLRAVTGDSTDRRHHGIEVVDERDFVRRYGEMDQVVVV